MASTLLEFRDVCKRFGGTLAVNHVSFSVRPGEVHALLGENGAGKSTLVKICGGIHKKDSGSIIWEGQEVDIQNPWVAENLGISIVHQETPMCKNLSVAANVFMGPSLPGKGLFPDWNQMNAETQRLFETLGVELDPKQMVSRCTIAEQQLIMIAKALRKESKLLIMDEPTSALSPAEVEVLFRIIRKLKSQGRTVIFISHRMDEVMEISDRMTVMKDGKYVGTVDRSEATIEKIANMMVGRAVIETAKDQGRRFGEPVLRVRNLSHGATRLHKISFDLREGEILGLAGIRGAGRTELAKCLIGVYQPDEGEVELFGQKVQIRSPQEAIAHGIGYLPEDRGGLGILPEMDIKGNSCLAILDKLTRLLLVNHRKMTETTSHYIKTLKINARGMHQKVGSLSGGNQQKVLFARWLAVQPKILILDEPTRGIDVGTKTEIRNLVVDLASQGYSIIFISSELPEVISVSDRILVLSHGRITGEFNASEATEEKIMMKAVASAS